MNRLFQFQTHPFRLLLYLEWILLGITTLIEFPLADVPPPPDSLALSSATLDHVSSLITILSIAAFGVMGLRLPNGRLLSRILYTSFGFGLVVLAVVVGSKGVYFFPSLLLILVIRSCLIFELTGRLIVTGIAFISFLLTWFLPVRNIHFVSGSALPPNLPVPFSGSAPRAIPVSPQKITFKLAISEDQVRGFVLNLALHTTLLFGLVLVFVLLLVNALLAERQSRQKLAIANDKLRQYARRIEDQATLQERNRIAREIHDSLGHSLTAQSIQLENVAMFLQSNADKAQAFLVEAKRLGSEALQAVRQSVCALRCDPLQGQSLEDAIAFLVKDFQQTTGIEPTCMISLPLPLSSKVKTAIYRIVQEALTNISKHGAATQVRIHLQGNPEDLSLLVEDNGRGFNEEENTTGFGLQSMRERTVALGGQFNIVSELGAGCRIMAYIPLSRLSL
ncbi:MAG TPA: sensor histidine kinase [Coleofasciculaceae cyanobacterium]